MNQNSNDLMSKGCFALMGLVVVIPLLLYFIEAIFPILVLGSIVAGIYLLMRWDGPERRLTGPLEKIH